MHRFSEVALAGFLFATVGVSMVRADEFDRLEGEALSALVRGKEATRHAFLAIGEIEALPNVLKDSRATLLLATTDQGNVARLLVSPALRKPAGGQGEPIPVLLLERFDTFETGNLATRLARGKELILFGGFAFDLDSGQVVPDGQGGDLRFEVRPGSPPRLAVLPGSKLFSVRSLPAPASGGARPSLGRGVRPDDFNGRFRLFANGQWSGTLDLKVDGGGVVSGRFRSDLNGTSYPVTGQVSAEVPQRIAFAVAFPRTRQEFEGLIWTEGKGALAGTMTMLDRAFGFFALREGGRFAPDGEDLGPLNGESTRPGRKVVTVRKGQYTLDGKPRTDQELTDALRQALAAEPATWVLLRVPQDEPFATVNTAFEVLGAAGIMSIRVAPADTEP